MGPKVQQDISYSPYLQFWMKSESEFFYSLDWQSSREFRLIIGWVAVAFWSEALIIVEEGQFNFNVGLV